eukprot:1844801-Pleurochrysis_carterae.AAC.1
MTLAASIPRTVPPCPRHRHPPSPRSPVAACPPERADKSAQCPCANALSARSPSRPARPALREGPLHPLCASIFPQRFPGRARGRWPLPWQPASIPPWSRGLLHRDR